MSDSIARPNTAPAVRLRAVALPAEHGGWSFLLEPILLSLLVAPSMPGALFGVGMGFAFLARHPLKLTLSDRLRGKRLARTGPAERFALIYALGGLIGFGLGAATGGGELLLPLLAVSPLFALQAYFDATRRSRMATAEVIGVVSLAAVAVSIILAAGWSVESALALWVLLIARGVPSVVYVRARLRLERSQPYSRWLPLLAHVLAIIVVLGLVVISLLPPWSIAAPLVLLVRAAYGLSPYRQGRAAKQIGLQEVGFGVLFIALTALSYAAATP